MVAVIEVEPFRISKKGFPEWHPADQDDLLVCLEVAHAESVRDYSRGGIGSRKIPKNIQAHILRLTMPHKGNIKVVAGDGETYVYYGGTHAPKRQPYLRGVGEGHGHITVGRHGLITYDRRVDYTRNSHYPRRKRRRS